MFREVVALEINGYPVAWEISDERWDDGSLEFEVWFTRKGYLDMS